MLGQYPQSRRYRENSIYAAGEALSEPSLFDGLIIGRGVYHHIPGRENRVKFLTACRHQIKDDAPFFLGDFLIRTDSGHRLSGLSPSKKVERGDSISFSFIHYFTRDEILLELDLAGFKLVEYRTTPFPGREKSLAHVVARAKSQATHVRSPPKQTSERG